MRAAFVDPEVLRKDPSEWPPKQTPKVNCSKSELLKFASRWDELGACMLLPLEQKNFKEAVGLFCVGKDAKYDRLIINPVTINSRMHSISKSTKELAPGCMLGLLHVEDDMMFRFQADDLFWSQNLGLPGMPFVKFFIPMKYPISDLISLSSVVNLC